MLEQKKIIEYLNTYKEQVGYKFVERDHQHWLNGDKLMSVTQFINSDKEPFDAEKISERCSRDPNSIYYKIKPEQIRFYWNLRTHLGTNKHAQVERWLKRNLSKDDNFTEQIHFEEHGITPENTISEFEFCSEKYMLGGIADIVQFVETDDKVTIYISDVKTVNEISDWNYEGFVRQLLTLSKLLNMMLKEYESDKKIVVRPKYIIHIKPFQKEVREGLDIWDLESFEPPLFIKVDNYKNFLPRLKNLFEKRLEELIPF